MIANGGCTTALTTNCGINSIYASSELEKVLTMWLSLSTLMILPH